MENELRYYIKVIRDLITNEGYEPAYLVTAVKLPDGTIELSVSATNILDKLVSLLDDYDEDMHLKVDNEVSITQLMVV